jgi:hypothetical protein
VTAMFEEEVVLGGGGAGKWASQYAAGEGSSGEGVSTSEILHMMGGKGNGKGRGDGEGLGHSTSAGSVNLSTSTSTSTTTTSGSGSGGHIHTGRKSPRIGMLIMKSTNGSPLNAAAVGVGGPPPFPHNNTHTHTHHHHHTHTNPCKSGNSGDFVFQPSPALKAARAVRDREDPHHKHGHKHSHTHNPHSRDKTHSPTHKHALLNDGESEARVVYSSEQENFDLGGFTIGRGGLVSSPRNSVRRRPSLNAGDNFVVLARLGSGNSSAVHKALHVPTMRLVALKALPLYDAERRAQVCTYMYTHTHT